MKNPSFEEFKENIFTSVISGDSITFPRGGVLFTSAARRFPSVGMMKYVVTVLIVHKVLVVEMDSMID